jgi:hypothetical protein
VRCAIEQTIAGWQLQVGWWWWCCKTAVGGCGDGGVCAVVVCLAELPGVMARPSSGWTARSVSVQVPSLLCQRMFVALALKNVAICKIKKTKNNNKKKKHHIWYHSGAFTCGGVL